MILWNLTWTLADENLLLIMLAFGEKSFISMYQSVNWVACVHAQFNFLSVHAWIWASMHICLDNWCLTINCLGFFLVLLRTGFSVTQLQILIWLCMPMLHSHTCHSKKELEVALVLFFIGLTSGIYCRILNDANMGHAYDGLLWTLRYILWFSITIHYFLSKIFVCLKHVCYYVRHWLLVGFNFRYC